MTGYDIGEIEKQMSDIYDRGGIEQGLFAESYKAAIEIKDFIKGLEGRLDTAKDLDGLKKQYSQARADGKKVTDGLEGMLGKYLAHGKSNKRIASEYKDLVKLSNKVKLQARRHLRDALSQVDIGYLAYESKIRLNNTIRNLNGKLKEAKGEKAVDKALGSAHTAAVNLTGGI